MSINITILGQAISFFIFVVFCVKYIWGPIISVIEKRQKSISDIFIDAEESKKKSEIALIEANNFLNKAKSEAELIIQQANQYGMQLIDQAKHKAESEKNKILFQAHQAISLEKKCIAEELRKEIGLMVISGVERIIGCSIDNKYIDRTVINEIISELKNSK